MSEQRYYFRYLSIGNIQVMAISECLITSHPPRITRLASNEIFSPSNKIHQEVVRATDLSALLYRGAV